MSEEKKVESTAEAAGNSEQIKDKEVDPNLGGGEGKSTETKPSATDEGKKDEGKKEETVPKEQYDNLETKLGVQGRELGENKIWFENASPLLERLDANKDLVKAILNDKISPELVQSVLKGEVPVKEAKTVSKAHEEVKKDLGKKDYEKTSPEDVKKMVSEKVKEGVEESEKKMTQKMTDNKKMQDFEDKVNTFVANTPDFPEHSKAINKWFDEHPDQDDIEIAYKVVKAEALAKKIEEDKTKQKGDAAKDLAANAGGGASQGTVHIKDEAEVDKLISSKSSPNVF